MKIDRWDRMVDEQLSFQKLVYPEAFSDGSDDDCRTSITKEMVLHLISEANELLQEMAWKAKRREHQKLVRTNILDELVDMLKFVMSMAVIWRFDSGEIYRAFMEKSGVVLQRYNQEYPMYEIIRSGARVVVLDIDGVLSDWPYCFYDFIRRKHEPNLVYNDGVQNPFEALDIDPLTIRRYKDEYRQSGAKRFLPVVRGSIEFTKWLREHGFKIVLVTARPYHEYSRIFGDTLYWLKFHGFEFDAIMWSDRKEERLAEEFDIESIAVFVDDTKANVDMARACGISSALLKRPYNPEGVTFDEIRRVLE